MNWECAVLVAAVALTIFLRMRAQEGVTKENKPQPKGGKSKRDDGKSGRGAFSPLTPTSTTCTSHNLVTLPASPQAATLCSVHLQLNSSSVDLSPLQMLPQLKRLSIQRFVTLFRCCCKCILVINACSSSISLVY